MSPEQIRELLRREFPRIRPEGRGWVLETTPDILLPVPHPDDKLAYVAHQERWSAAQRRDIELALQKRIPVLPDLATLYELRQLLEAAD